MHRRRRGPVRGRNVQPSNPPGARVVCVGIPVQAADANHLPLIDGDKQSLAGGIEAINTARPVVAQSFDESKILSCTRRRRPERIRSSR